MGAWRGEQERKDVVSTGRAALAAIRDGKGGVAPASRAPRHGAQVGLYI